MACIPPVNGIEGAIGGWDALLGTEMPDTELHVEFDQPQEVFFPGHPISGRVLLTTTDKYKARAVKVKFEGNAYTDWNDWETVRRVDAEGKTHFDRRRVHYSGTVNYLEHEILLWASRDGSNEIAAGKYTWPFSFTLPATIPPSFEGKYGYIRYSATAEVDRPWRFDKAKKRCITVSPLLDLNQMPQAMTPLHDEASENIGCCCFRKGHLELRVDIPKAGFVPGEVVPLNLHILNHGTVAVTEAKARIMQTSTFVAYRHGFATTFGGDVITGGGIGGQMQETRRESGEAIKSTQRLTVEPGKEHKLAVELRLPSVVPTINQFCPLITVEYLVEVSVDTASTFNSSVDCEVPILIGTVPIRQFLPPAYYPPNPAVLPSVPMPLPPQVGSVVAPPGYGFLPGHEMPPEEVGGGLPYPEEDKNRVVIPSAPPISFEDSVYGADGTQLNADENEKPFVPKYPVFNDLPVYNPTAPPKE